MIINNQFIHKEQLASVEAGVVMADKPGDVILRAEYLIKEHLIEVCLNEEPVIRLVCTPNRLPELVIGRLATEGLIKDGTVVDSLYICENGGRARIYLKQGEEPVRGNAQLYTEPSCCTENKLIGSFMQLGKMQKLDYAEYSEKSILELIAKFYDNSSLHRKTGGTHSCYLSYQGSYREVFEDIGRHNALDKAVGYAIINGFNLNECMLFTTGRVPVDMVKKVIIAKIPVLVSKAVPTAEAVELARQFNLTLICRAWDDSYEIFSSPFRDRLQKNTYIEIERKEVNDRA